MLVIDFLNIFQAFWHLIIFSKMLQKVLFHKHAMYYAFVFLSKFHFNIISKNCHVTRAFFACISKRSQHNERPKTEFSFWRKKIFVVMFRLSKFNFWLRNDIHHEWSFYLEFCDYKNVWKQLNELFGTICRVLCVITVKSLNREVLCSKLTIWDQKLGLNLFFTAVNSI